VPNKFEDLNMPDEDFGMPPSEGMPDPTAEDQPPSDLEPAPEPEPEAREEPEATPKAKPKRGGGVMAVLARADLYTVLLAISLAAVLIAVFCLAMEWGSYGFDRNPKVSAVAPVSQYVLCLDSSVDARADDHMVG
jgi:hypothetical protein